MHIVPKERALRQRRMFRSIQEFSAAALGSSARASRSLASE
nr:MAG TPA: hypothetical protein [Caudoviricetes sp.]